VKHRLVSAIVAVVAVMGLSGIAAAEESQVFCGPDERSHYRCGAILVILTAETTETIADVIKRMGGDPEADVLQEFTAVRDLLDPDGVVEDTSFAPIYQVAVPVGQEHEIAEAYRADSAVYGADVDRETIGETTPNTAMATSGQPSLMVAAGACLLLVAGMLARVLRGPASRGGGVDMQSPRGDEARSGHRPE